MIIDEDAYLEHYGTLRKSGRYPWGSGGNSDGTTTTFRHMDFLAHVNNLKKQGLSEKEIADSFGIRQADLRKYKSISKEQVKQERIGEIIKLSKDGLSNVAIGKELGIAESNVRALRADIDKDDQTSITNLTNLLREQVDQKRYIDIGKGTEYQFNASYDKMKTVARALEEEGYKRYYQKIPTGGGNSTTLKALCAPDVTWSEFSKNVHNVSTLRGYSDDGGETLFGILPPLSLSSDRIKVRYAEEGGDQADGVVYVRPGVPDVNIGGKSYAQVRVLVDGTHYIKGMAMYKADLPDGADLVFNTNKSNTGNKLDALKPISTDPDNPFGSMIDRQIGVVGEKGRVQELTSVMNIVNEEGSWGKWSNTISSQVLSKQRPRLAKEQLDMAYEQRYNDYVEITKLTNPTVRRKLLEEFGDEADSAAVHLKAAALPRQGVHVILPVEGMTKHEVYAPNYNDGDRVVLIRHPHGGTFEIPELTVNNKNTQARRLIGSAAIDAVGIHPSVAERLSGADFDGDTVLVIPNNNKQISHKPALAELNGFNPKKQYQGYPGMKVLPTNRVGREMGDVSNLITDMTIKGASDSEIARAVKHSMVVIDANKHELNYKKSFEDHGIAQLKAKYQGGPRSGASTTISLAKSTERIPQVKNERPIDPATGKRRLIPTGETYVDKNGKVVESKTKFPLLAITDDAHTISSGQPIERIYADHSNKLKALANQARKESVNTKRAAYSPSANKTYAKEVASLNSKLAIARRNAPFERKARLLADSIYKMKLQEDPAMETPTKKKVYAQAITAMRLKVGAKKVPIDITQEEWNAIQAGALHDTRVREILVNTDADVVRAYATPRSRVLMTSNKVKRAQAMYDLGYTRAQVAKQLGVSLSTLDKSIGNGGE